ncbi:hypothetical protein BS47DRAFT_823977 [Hydnum rufescens UP504]|uniref:Prefoldin subunit 1 n=1 Tax=Hydnum rufescens UP504 TaxID=1448309 RepID=A0A9P6DV74_9AGAM|nr:hypothetical protein BS47DRAFT_823977 [Hydnum rufescens UP504]
MSQLPDDTLRKILAQIQQTAHQSSRNLSLSRAQTAQKDKERRILQLTIAEIGTFPRTEAVKLYKGVGKMFVNVPRDAMEKDLRNQEKELSDDIVNLNKRANIWRSNTRRPALSFAIYFHSSESKS